MKLPKLIKLSASGEIRSRRNRKIVLRYHKPNKENVLEIINQKKHLSQIETSLTIMLTKYTKEEKRTKMIITL